MFDSLDGGFVPICLLVVFIAWFISGVRDVSPRGLLTVLVPVVVSMLWYVVPNFFKDQPDWNDSTWVAWGIMATIAWSVAAVPASILSVLLFSLLRKKAASWKQSPRQP